jgi:phosphoesterase RecJ-like protein
MKNIIKSIENVNHIVVIADKEQTVDSIASASAFYTYLLMLHKKVSFFCIDKELRYKLSFLPWYEKIRGTFPSSGELAISFNCIDASSIGTKLECDLINISYIGTKLDFAKYNLIDTSAISTTQVLFNFFRSNNIKINKKMATSLYGGVLENTECFISDNMDGIIFAMVEELIRCGAEYKKCNKFLKKTQTLASLRLKAFIFEKIKLLNEARVALVLITQEDIKKTGATKDDIDKAFKEVLFLPTVEILVILKEKDDFSIDGSVSIDSGIDLKNLVTILDGVINANSISFNIENKFNLKEASHKVMKLINEEI